MDASASWEDAEGAASGFETRVAPVATAPAGAPAAPSQGQPADSLTPDNPFDKHVPANVANPDDDLPAGGGPPNPLAAADAAQAPAPGAPVQTDQGTKPGLLDVAASALRQSNIVSSLYDRMTLHPDSDAPAQKGYDALDDVHGYEDYAARFTQSESPQQTAVIKGRIDAENADKQVIARAGWGGVAASVAAGIIDPMTLALMAIPGVGEAAGGSRLLSIGKAVGVNVAAGEAQQAALTQTQETTNYTDGIGWRIGANALLAGTLGAIATRVPKAEFDAAANTVRDMTTGEKPNGISTAGAQQVPETSLEQESISKGGKGIANSVGQISPITRVFANSPEVESRRLAQGLVDVPYILNKNEQGIATGSSVEMRSKQTVDSRQFQLTTMIDNQYATHAADAAAKGEPVMTRPQFSEAISDAMSNSDAHDNPQVSVVAKFIRPMFSADREDLNKLGVTEGTDVMGAPSYFPRVWDQHEVMHNQTALEGVLRDWYTNNPKRVPLTPAELKAQEAARPEEPYKTLYHGSNYVFGEFDHSKIGNGEGNQSYGHGIYTAENEDVARQYQNLHSINTKISPEDLKEYYKPGRDISPYGSTDGSGTVDKVKSYDQKKGYVTVERTENGRTREVTYGDMGADWIKVRRALGQDIHLSPQMYKVKVKVSDIDKMLDWDKPINEQPHVMAALGIDKDTPRTITKESDPSLALEGETDQEKIAREGAAASGAAVTRMEVPNPELKGVNPDWTGGELHKALVNGKTAHGIDPYKDTRGAAMDAADMLRKGGVTGIKYLDGASRAKGKGTTNHVLFDGTESQITHRNDELINPEAHAATTMPPAPVDKPIYREPAEVSSAVRDTIDHILGLNRGTADIGVGAKNPKSLQARALDVPDQLLKPWMSSDVEHVMESYNRSMQPQLEIRKAYGSADLTDQMQKISDNYRIKIAAAGDDDVAKAKLMKQQSNDIADLTLMRDRALNQNGPTSNMPLTVIRIGQIARSFNYLASLGGQTLSALPDLGRLVARYGLGNTALRTGQLLSGMSGGLMKEDAQRMGTALDVVLHTRQHSLEGVGDEMAGSDKFMKHMQNLTNKFTKVTGIASWDAMMRTLSSQLEQDAMKRMLDGNVGDWEKAKLASHGIGEADTDAIRAQWAQFGSNENGLNRAHTDLWTDKAAASKVEQAVQRAGSSNAFFIGKGDMPAFASNELGKMMVQFKGFAISSVNRLAIPLAQGLAHGDIKAANGLASMLALGALTYFTKEIAAGNKPDLSPDRLIPEMIQRSGILTYLPDLYDPASGFLHLPRFSKFKDTAPLTTLLGPTVNKLDSILPTIANATAGQMSAHDLHKFRQLIPFNNLFYFNRLVNAVEGKTADLFHLKNATGAPMSNYLNPFQDQAPKPEKPDNAHLFGIQAIPNQT